MAVLLRRMGTLLLMSVLAVSSAYAERISDIRNTKHNFSATVVPSLVDGTTRSVMATSESQICAFCHTPHAAAQAPMAPIWNRKLTGASYTPYTSSSIEAIDLGEPNFKSKLCLSCHDGTLAIGSVNVLNRQEKVDVDMIGTALDGTMPVGAGERSGFTRRIGTDLTNDHPISFTYDSAQAARDGELRYPNIEPSIGNRRPGHKPTLPLENDQMECITCHDPHIRDSSGDNIKFLRVNRFQQAPPVEGTFDQASDIICLACHEKAGWALSAHSYPPVADERYTDAAADLREFPRNLQVWQAACFNCHDPHTVQGSRRLLREGTDDAGQLQASGIRVKQGGDHAIEETCYACHSVDGNVLQGQGSSNFQVPDVKTDFTTMRIHMPISNRDQRAGMEVHAIGTDESVPQDGKDFLESRENLGRGNLTNRHAECTDCHNPHRVIQNRLFNADPTVPDGQGTHNHGGGSGDIANNPEGMHTNIASGVLRGISGVEPVYGSTAFGSNPIGFEVKKGDPGIGGSTAVSAPYVTREYQVCLKCHSNYAYDSPPPLGTHGGSTPANTNGMFFYTNQAMEYQAPAGHEGEGTAPTPSGAFEGIDGGGNVVDYNTNNHRAWHPVMEPTGRTPSVRVASSGLWLSPFNAAVGVQTMYCTDCHGSDTAPGTAVPRGGDRGNVWGPHGSDNDFLLKGQWNRDTGPDQPDALCFKCHEYDSYGKSYPAGGPPPVVPKNSGFRKSPLGPPFGCIVGTQNNLHIGHAKEDAVKNFRCSYCHIAIPHGWKNKNFLANLNDVGPEVGVQAGSQYRNKQTPGETLSPYYMNTMLKVINFKTSGTWLDTDCGSAGDPGNGDAGGNGGGAWMTNMNPGTGGEGCSLIE